MLPSSLIASFHNHSLPTSNHGIFTSVVQSSLKRYLQDRLGKTTPVGDITSPDSLPSEIRTQSVQMCQLAYHGIEENKATFTDTDLAILSIPKEISNIGLLQTVPSIISDGHLVYYCFLHLSIQELLAAIHISLMSPKQQISVFQKLFGNPRFSAVFQFYAGITKLRTSRPILSKLPRFLCPVPGTVFDLVRNIVKSEKKKKVSESKTLLLSLINCLHEADDSSLCVFVADLLNHHLDLYNTTMNPIDCLSVGYFASVCSNTNEFTLRLANCSIGDQGSKFLARGLSKCPNSHYKISLNLFNNNIRDEGIHHIAEVIENTSLIYTLNLSNNPIGNSGLTTICEALSTNKSLKSLNLTNCSLTILSDDNGAALYQLLKINTYLEHLHLFINRVTNCRHIAAGLAVNKTLRRLNLAHCKLTDQSIEELSTGLINKIERLDIDSNFSITEDGMKTLARHLTTHCSELTYLLIPSHLRSCIKTVFRDANKERKRNGLHDIDVP